MPSPGALSIQLSCAKGSEGSLDTTLMDSVLDFGSGQRRTQKLHALSDGSEVGVVPAIS